MRPLCGVQRDGNRKECLRDYAGFPNKIHRAGLGGSPR